jgi:type I restriction enzyme S subunit
VPVEEPSTASDEELDQLFNSIAESMLRLISTLHMMNTRLAASRDLLLPRLFSGELSASAAERELEVVA